MNDFKYLISSIVLWFIIASVIYFPNSVLKNSGSASTPEVESESISEDTEDIININDLYKNVNTSKYDTVGITYQVTIDKINNNDIDMIYYTSTSDYMYLYSEKEDTLYKTNTSDLDTFKMKILESGIPIKPVSECEGVKTNIFIKLVDLFLLPLLILCIFYRIVSKFTNSMLPSQTNTNITIGNEIITDKIITDKSNNSDIKTFDDVAGLHEVKKDMLCLVDFLKNGDKYKKAGAKLPKGVILYGPPGTGKTLLAKAVAGEAGVKFFYISASDFIEMYVGVGAKRVRELFAEAKKNTPCIIFIDELDAIGGKRGEVGNGNTEYRQTLNALLTEMSGFKSSEGILVIGATNRIEDLDSALLRPGRFTNKYCVPLPETIKERKEIINLYIKDKALSDDVDIDVLAKDTIGMSPAKIEAILNDAAIISVQDGKAFIDKKSIDKAMIKHALQGHIKEDQSERDENELKTVAYHEAGHALVGKLFGKSITKVTILSTTSGAGGVTFSTPSKTGLYTKLDLEQEIMELYGGRCAEYLYHQGDETLITTGCSNDIERADNIIENMITSYGMANNKFGLITLKDMNNAEVEKIILDEKIKLSKEFEQKTLDILKKNFHKLEEIALLLLTNETIYENQLNNIINNDCLMV